MSSRKIDRAKYGPGMGEVFLSVILSLLLGAALAVAELVWKPVKEVTQLPKKRPAGMVYLVESNGSGSGAQWMRKQQLFTGGSSVEVNDGDLNAWYTSAMAPAAGAKRKAGPFGGVLELDRPYFQIRNGRLEISSKGTLNVHWFGLKHAVIVQVAGHFAKMDGEYSLVPDRFYVGSCPLQRLPVVGNLVLRYLLGRHPAPKPIAAAWAKLTDVSIKNGALMLKMP